MSLGLCYKPRCTEVGSYGFFLLQLPSRTLFGGISTVEKTRKKKKGKESKNKSHHYSGLVPGVGLKALFSNLAEKPNSDPPTSSCRDAALNAAAGGASLKLTPSPPQASLIGSGWGQVEDLPPPCLCSGRDSAGHRAEKLLCTLPRLQGGIV